MSADLGDIAGLATAVGLLDGGGSPTEGWFADPGRFLSSILSNPVQRQALVDTVDDLLGGSEASTDASGRTWLPLFEQDPVAVSVVLAEVGGGASVHVGLGARVRSASGPARVGVDVDAYVPLFAASGTTSVEDPLLIGKPGADIEVRLALSLPTGTSTGGVELASAEVSATIPTGGGEPRIGLALRGLRMPGAAAARDVVVSADDIADLDDAVLELVLGLVQASADGLGPTDPGRGLAGLLGLVDGDGVPDFPVQDLLERGPIALAAWWSSCLQGPPRAIWLGHLATLLSGTVAGLGEAARVRVPIGPVTVVLDVASVPSAGGLARVTPQVAVEVSGAAGTSLVLQVKPISLDLATGAAVALPSLSATARVTSGGPGPLLGPVAGPGGLQITVGSFSGGFELDADRRPLLVLRAHDAVVGTTSYPALDLTDGDALAGVGANAVGDAAATLLDGLGPLGTAVAVLLGFEDPPAGPAPRVDPVRLLQDPVGALRERWSALLASAPDIVRSVLATWQGATAAQALQTTAVTGDGTPATPYRVAVTGDVDLLLTRVGTVVSLDLAARVATDLALSAEIGVDLRLGLLRADLQATRPSAQFGTGLIAVLSLSGAADQDLRLVADGYGLVLHSVGARVSWTPTSGVRVDPWLDAPRLVVAGAERSLASLVDGGLAVGSATGLALPPALPTDPAAWLPGVWDALESLAGAALSSAARERARVAGAPDAVATLLAAATDLFGWSAAGRPSLNRLSLAALIADPGAELERWVALVTGAGGGRARLPERALGYLARLLGGPGGVGSGVVGAPWALALPGVDVDVEAAARLRALTGWTSAVPALLLSMGAPTMDRYGSRAPLALVGWRPGDEGLTHDLLATGLAEDGAIDDVLADALAGRGPVADGLDALLQRWTGTDGVVAVADDAVPAGLSVHRPSELAHTARLDAATVTAALEAVWEELGGPPARLVLVGVVVDGEPDVLPPSTDAGTVTEIDLRLAGAPVEAFAVPAAAAVGRTVVRLAGKAAAANGSVGGYAGQVARLRRTLGGLASGAPVVVVAGPAAGRPAVDAAAGLAGITAVVTVGTPWTPLTLADVDVAPAADTLRLLQTLVDLGEDDLRAELAAELATASDAERAELLAVDSDLALGRDLVAGLLARDVRGDPLVELSAPTPAVPAGVTVHAVVGSCSPEACERALTALVASALAARSRRRVTAALGETVTGALGLHLPAGIGSAAAGLRAALGADVDVVRVGTDGLLGPRLRLLLRVSGDGRWLVGGPDGARTAGARPLAVRSLTLEVQVPLPLPFGATPAAGFGRLVLHDATAFGVHKARWVVDLSSVDAGALVPEVRALLGEVAGQLRSQATGGADAAIAGLVDALTALGLLDASGGFDATSLTALLGEPRATIEALLADVARTTRLATGLRAALGDVRIVAASPSLVNTVELRSGAAVVLVDLAARSVTVDASTVLVGGDVEAALRLTASPSGARVEASVGSVGLTATGPGRPAAGLSLTAELPRGQAPTMQVTASTRNPGGRHEVRLWPAGAALTDELLALVPDAAAAMALHAAVTALRSTLAGLDTGGGPAPGPLVDAVLSAVGLLGGTGGDRSVVWPSGLVTAPTAWLAHLTDGLPAAVPTLVDAVAGLLSAAGPRDPGSLPIVDGVVLRTSAPGGLLRVVLDVDSAAFTGAVPDLALRVSAGLALAPGGPLPEVAVDVGAQGVGAVRLRVGTISGGADAAVGVTVSLVPDARPEIVVYPSPRGLSSLADAAAAGALAALPALLTRLAEEDPVDPAPASTPLQVAARVVARSGRALGLATGVPAVFTGPPLAAFAADPAAAFAARSAVLAGAGLALVVEAVEAALGADPNRSVTSAAGRVGLSVGPAARRVVLGWSPGTGTIDVAVTVAAVPGVGQLAAMVRVGPLGVELVDVQVGPASIALDGVTLAPFARVAAGTSLPAPTVDVGLGAGGTQRLLVRFDGSGVQLLSASGPPSAVPSGDPAAVAGAVVGVLLDVAGGVVLAVSAVRDGLATQVLGTTTAAELLDGVLVATGPVRLSPGLAADVVDADALVRRLAVLVGNIADAMAAPLVIAETLAVRITKGGPANDTLGLTVAVVGEEWVLNPGSDVLVGLVTDAAWISPVVPSGITIEAVRLPAAGPILFAPGVVVGGVGVRFSRTSGPLLDAGITLDSVSLLGFGVVRAGAVAGSVDVGGGARVELAGIGIPLGGASGGQNAAAQGVMPAGGGGDAAPAPRFSPALAIQQPPGGQLAVSFSAGPGGGPWWLAIQREFGPIYLEQVGLAVGQDGTNITSIGVLIDGKVSLFGLSAAVDDLSITYQVQGSGSPFDASRWTVDVAGFAVTAEMSGLTLAGGLRKFTPSEGGVEYLGMLLARLGVYGITVYGGFGQVGPPEDQYSSMFLFGAVNGPLGGPPAFFVTGIGGGFGFNRGLVVPADLSQFASYPLIKALDPAARAGDPFAELAQARVFFPAQRGQFWFAAGVSFTSFALVDGIVVVAVAFGNGFELNILGLARVALPRPQLALVSIELALVARVSTREGIVLVQAQLTDNSWLIAPAVRLTGGFAFAAWFAGPNRGQFVLSLGGYHPDFHRDGYPVVPRLGLTLSIGDLVTVTGGSYFALTSEALMAGLKVEIHAQIGPAWAHLVFGADGIVYFDPFFLSVTIYASIDAGITIDLWFAEITISVHLSARLTVTGPPFHVVARFEVGPVGLTFEVGPSDNTPAPISWAQFVAKYLEEATPGVARTLTAITGVGTVPPTGDAAKGGAVSPDGQPDRPFKVVAEFTATVTSTVPVRELGTAAGVQTITVSHNLWVAPLGPGGATTPRVTLRLRTRLTTGAGAGGPDTAAPDRIGALTVSAKRDGAFPIGAWGPAQDATDPKVPAGDVITAADRIELVASAHIPAAGPDIPYRQVQTGSRRVLPLLPGGRTATITALTAQTQLLHSALAAARVDAGPGLDDAGFARHLLATRGGRSELDVATWSAQLAAPVLLGSLGEGLGGPAAAVAVGQSRVPARSEAELRAPRLLAVLASGQPRALRVPDDGERVGRAVRGTSVSAELMRAVVDRDDVARMAAPSTAATAAALHSALPARLARLAPQAIATSTTVLAAGAVPTTAATTVGATALAARATDPATLNRLARRTDELLVGKAQLADGEVAVIELPDADRDTGDGSREQRPRLVCRDGRVRAVLLANAGQTMADVELGPGESVIAPPGTRTVVVVGGPPPAPFPDPWAISGGWTASRSVPSASDGLLVADGCVVDVLDRVPTRGTDPVRAAWASPAELLGSERAVVTTLAAPARVGDPDPLVIAAVAVGVTGPDASGLAIGLEGARQSGSAYVTTDAGGASVLVVALTDLDATGVVRVTVAADPQVATRDLVGVVAVAGRSRAIQAGGVAAAAGWLAEAVSSSGLARLVDPPTVPGPRVSTLAWEVS